MRKKTYAECTRMVAAVRSLFLLALTSVTLPAWSDSGAEYLFFTQFDGFYRTGQADSLDIDDNGLEPGADFFAAYQQGSFQMLGEYFLNEDESELERAQIGWSFGEPSVWLGRWHNPIGLWNTLYHHGTYLQTSVSRPGMVEFEDDGGIFPMHVSGLLVEGAHAFGDRGLDYQIAIGLGPGYDNFGGALEPLNLLDPSDGEQDLATTVQLAYRPDALGSNSVGIFASATLMPGIDGPVEEIKQRMVGAYVDWSVARWHFTSELYYAHSRVTRAVGRETGSFVNGYLQAEYSVSPNWTAYSRVEDNSDDADNPYLALFPSHVAARQLIGINYRLARNQVLKLEVSNVDSLETRFSEFVLQWSAVLP